MGTELKMRGVEVPSHVESIWSALALTENTSVIKEIHLDYINAGAEFIIANNYSNKSLILFLSYICCECNILCIIFIL